MTEELVVLKHNMGFWDILIKTLKINNILRNRKNVEKGVPCGRRKSDRKSTSNSKFYLPIRSVAQCVTDGHSPKDARCLRWLGLGCVRCPQNGGGPLSGLARCRRAIDSNWTDSVGFVSSAVGNFCW